MKIKIKWGVKGCRVTFFGPCFEWLPKLDEVRKNQEKYWFFSSRKTSITSIQYMGVTPQKIIEVLEKHEQVVSPTRNSYGVNGSTYLITRKFTPSIKKIILIGSNQLGRCSIYLEDHSPEKVGYLEYFRYPYSITIKGSEVLLEYSSKSLSDVLHLVKNETEYYLQITSLCNGKTEVEKTGRGKIRFKMKSLLKKYKTGDFCLLVEKR